MTIPFFNYPALFGDQEEKFVEIFRTVGRRGAFIMQDDLRNFEAEVAAYSGAAHGIGVANATDGLELLLAAGGIGPGDEVIFCSHTMVATAGAIHSVGATPVPAEVGSDHLIDADKIEGLITERTRAIMPTQLNGRVADMDKILAIANKHGLDLYEDAAQGLGASYKGRFAGTFGKGGCISFYPAKNLGCFGDGGLVLTNDTKLYNAMMAMRDHGRDPQTGEIVGWGRNSRLDNLQAAILSHLFKGYDDIVARRRAIAARYNRRLQHINSLVLPPPPDADPARFDVFQNYEIEADRRDELKVHLSARGIGSLIQWGGKAVHQYPALKLSAHLPYTEELMARMIMLPLNLSITDDEVDAVCDAIESFYTHG